ncbi:MAG TPA: asparagine synthase (glutamine-hydrolyzing), partial [Longimicrobiales bacterium]|nr:asparagine synthase (glutamine-hydrolyzing) [Longimicrobiales bacterium]
MCGIAGVYAFDDRPVCTKELVRMRDAMVHRGPDGAGVWSSEDSRVGLAHRRLAIIDLTDAALQPMANEDGSSRVVFNGEIYNHAPLRRELLERGHVFSTDHSDTEVILHASEEWGIDCVHRFRGMFAFALWDGRSHDLWLVRDRIGIKPLYYATHGGRLRFASEIKAILEAPDVPRAVDEVALFHYLSFLTTPAPMTLFSGISKLPGGCRARVRRDGTVEVQRYWDVWDQARLHDGTPPGQLMERILDELRTAVALRRVSDVPVGVFLSGGVDSSTNAVLFAEQSSEPVRTFSVGYDRDYGSYANEFVYARRVADMIGADHHEYRITLDEALETMPFIASMQDEPIADPVCLPLYFVSRLAKQSGVTVCQVGEGSDELFCGYPDWMRSLRLQRANALPVPRFLKRAGLGMMASAGLGGGLPYEWLRRGAYGEPVFWGGAESLTPHIKARLLSVDSRRRLRGLHSFDAVRPIHDRFLANAPADAGPLAWMSYVDLNFRLPELLLMRVDKMSMATSIECRVPFLDHEFVGLAMAIPEAMKIRNGVPKYALKEAVRGLLPDDLIDRRKQGFGVPVQEWLFDRMGPAIRTEVEWLTDQTDVFDRATVGTYL